MRFTITNKKTGEKKIISNINDSKKIKDEDVVKPTEENVMKEDATDKKDKLEFTEEEIKTLKDLIEVVPDLLGLVKKEPKEDKPEKKDKPEEDPEDIGVMMEKGPEKDPEEIDEDIDDDCISDECDDESLLGDSVSTEDSKSSNVNDSNEMDVDSYFDEYYKKQLRKGE